MKRNIIIVVLLFLLIAFVGIIISTPQNRIKRSSDKKIVLTTFTVLQDMAQNVAGDVIEVRSITKTGANIHSYEPTPSDLVRAQSVDLILDNGLNLELWAKKLFENIPDVPHVTVTEGIDPILIEKGAYKDTANPHAWMSPQVALIYVENIKKALISIAPEHEATFEANALAYTKDIMILGEQLQKTLEVLLEDKRFLVTCEGAFTYLTKDYGLTEVYMWPINSDSNGTPQQIASVIDAVNNNDIPTVYCESTVNTKSMEQVANETGTTFGGTFYVDSLSGADGPASTYLDLLEYNIDTLIKGWE